MERMHRIVLSGAIALLVLIVAPGVDARPADRTHAFAGSCSLAGTTTFSPGATFVQQELTLDSHLEGTCDGTLDGRTVSDTPVAVHNAGRSSGSCLHAETLAPG